MSSITPWPVFLTQICYLILRMTDIVPTYLSLISGLLLMGRSSNIVYAYCVSVVNICPKLSLFIYKCWSVCKRTVTLINPVVLRFWSNFDFS